MVPVPHPARDRAAGTGRAPHGYGGRAGAFAWPANVREVPAEDVRHADVDVVLYQSHAHWIADRHELLESDRQRPSSGRRRARPAPAVAHRHPPPVDDPGALIVHVTAFNRLMWDNGATPPR